MRGDIIFEVYGVHEGRREDTYFGAFLTLDEAQAQIGQLMLREMHGENWAERYHNKGFVVREKVVDDDFEIPSRPKPRDKYFVKTIRKPNRPGTWDSTMVEVFRRGLPDEAPQRICEYERGYSMLQTFEPFRQGNREFALISSDYTRTAVLDLDSGLVIAEEPESDPPGCGFCPVGFYVPDWWDLNDDSVLPGSKHWDADNEWPVGDFGFVWGCIWGDDGSWKVQHLDLRRVQEGNISRDERFGYVELATYGYKTPCLTPGPISNEHTKPPRFIDLSRDNGMTRITFTVEMLFDLESGKATEWQRLRNLNFE
jgi:hypothetical protein